MAGALFYLARHLIIFVFIHLWTNNQPCEYKFKRQLCGIGNTFTWVAKVRKHVFQTCIT